MEFLTLPKVEKANFDSVLINSLTSNVSFVHGGSWKDTHDALVVISYLNIYFGYVESLKLNF